MNADEARKQIVILEEQLKEHKRKKHKMYRKIDCITMIMAYKMLIEDQEG